MYIPQSIQAKADYKKCINFHGHTCMGVTIGYLAAKLGLELLTEIRSVDEELITIVETDACCCDAIQVLTGCTFGKGNFFLGNHLRETTIRGDYGDTIRGFHSGRHRLYGAGYGQRD